MHRTFSSRQTVVLIAICLVLLVVSYGPLQAGPTQPDGAVASLTRRAPRGWTFNVLVDDFRPQPIQSDPLYFYNRLDGDRGAVQNANITWGMGQVSATVSAGNSWGGVWTSLNHPAREAIPVNFSAILPAPIAVAYQSSITGLRIDIARATPNKTLKVELKLNGASQWMSQSVLSGGRQTLTYLLPPLGNIDQLVWILDGANAGDYVAVERIALTATTPIANTSMRAFVWSYGMLLNNWNPVTGLARDKAKDASGEFDAIPSTGALAAATVVAKQLGVVSQADAIRIVNQISNTLLLNIPRYHGLWPHFVTISTTAGITITPPTEWSSVDSAIAAISLLESQTALGLNTSGTQAMLQAIDWSDLNMPGGISHGYYYTQTKIPIPWDTFGGETWLIELARAAATGNTPNSITYPHPATASGSGFIDELAWLFFPPPNSGDYWGDDWNAYRKTAVDAQLSYYPNFNSSDCFSQLGLFGLSAAEVPDPSLVIPKTIYQPFGVGGRFAGPNDGSALLGSPVVVPHYAGMTASLRSTQATNMWAWLMNQGYFSPLNNVESLMFTPASNCTPSAVRWNQLKGSWNLALQALGWGRYVAQSCRQNPVLWDGVAKNLFLYAGYRRMVPPPAPPANGLFLPFIAGGQPGLCEAN